MTVEKTLTELKEELQQAIEMARLCGEPRDIYRSAAEDYIAALEKAFGLALAGSGDEMYWSCQGHPAWPDPLRKQSYDEAEEWYDEHVGQHPDIRVVEVVVLRLQVLPVSPLQPRERPNR